MPSAPSDASESTCAGRRGRSRKELSPLFDCQFPAAAPAAPHSDAASSDTTSATFRDEADLAPWVPPGVSVAKEARTWPKAGQRGGAEVP